MSAAGGALDGGIAALRTAFAEGTASPVDVLEVVDARIADTNGKLNVVVHRDEERARVAAQASLQRRRAGAPASDIDGAPILVKANIAIAGAPWTAAIKAYRDRVAGEDAFAVGLLREAGAVIVGAVNMHEAALGATTDGPLYGKAFNPLRDGFSPGGSSGGSAAAVAAGYAVAALGTDTLGSVRIPAAYCGVVGFKPTYGAVSQRGVAPLSWSLDNVGVHARRVADVERVLFHISAFDENDPHSIDGRRTLATSPLHMLTLGRVRFEDQVECAPDVLARFVEACARLQGAGARIIDIDLEGYAFAHMRRAGLMVCEAEASIAMTDKLQSEPDGFSAELRSMLAYGAGLPAEKLAHIRREIVASRSVAETALAQCDFLLLPTAPQTAFAHETPAPANQADLTAFANLAGLPAISVPMGLASNGLPTGLQIVGAPWTDIPVLSVAAAFESMQNG